MQLGYTAPMTEVASTLPARETLRSGPSVSFGPYLLLEALPWLLFATCARTYSRGLPGVLAISGMLIVQFAVFFAFLLASRRMIELAGGGTVLGRLTFKDQLALGKGVIWRLLALFFAVVVTALLLGMNKYRASYFWLGFDDIVFAWNGGFLPIWSAVVATITFLMVVEKGLDRRPKYISVLHQLKDRWRHLLPAVALLGLFLSGANFVQEHLNSNLEPLYAALPPPLRRYFYTGYFLGFSYLRLWVVVALLTYALRASYRQNPDDSAAEIKP